MTSRLFGYVRVSTADQNPEMQVAALVDAGVNPDYIFTDAKSGRKLANRDGLRRVLRNMRKGDDANDDFEEMAEVDLSRFGDDTETDDDDEAYLGASTLEKIRSQRLLDDSE